MGLLERAFIKDSDNIANIAVRQKYGELSGIVGIVLNLIISTGKLIAGSVFSSVSIVADGVNNLTDAASSIVTLIGFKISGKPADEKHPFGHARTEYISALIVSFIILFLGLQLVKSSVVKIFAPESTSFSILTVVVLAVSILLKLWLWYFNHRMGKKIDSTAILATATDSLNDVVATSAVLICLIISHLTKWELDGYIGVVVALLVIWTGVGTFRDTFNSLIGEAPDANLIQSIDKILKSDERVLGIHDLIIHNYGPSRWFASAHVEVSAKDNIMKCHDMIDNLEQEVNEKLGVLMTIHMDPIETDNESTNELKDMVYNIIKGIDSHLSMHDFRVVFGETHSNLIFDIEKPFSCLVENSTIVDEIDKAVKRKDKNLNVVIHIDTSYTTTTFGEKE